MLTPTDLTTEEKKKHRQDQLRGHKTVAQAAFNAVAPPEGTLRQLEGTTKRLQARKDHSMLTPESNY